MRLDALPRPDGAPFKCARDLRVLTWPYTVRCDRPAVGLLTEADYLKVQAHGIPMGGRLVCLKHMEEFEALR